MNFKDIKIILIEFVKLCYSRLLKITQDRMFLTVATNKSPENIAFIAHLSTLIWKISSPNPLAQKLFNKIEHKWNWEIDYETGILR